jgi:hypothetical protein
MFFKISSKNILDIPVLVSIYFLGVAVRIFQVRKISIIKYTGISQNLHEKNYKMK